MDITKIKPQNNLVLIKLRMDNDKIAGTNLYCETSFEPMKHTNVVGEVMAIGRCFNEALQKACQSQENDRHGLGADKKEWFNTQDILEMNQDSLRKKPTNEIDNNKFRKWMKNPKQVYKSRSVTPLVYR